MTACEINIGGFAFQPISQEEGREHGDGSFDQISIGNNGVFKSPGIITVLLQSEWYLLRCKVYSTDSVFNRAVRFVRTVEPEDNPVDLWREQDIKYFLPDEGIITTDPEGKVWWFHSPDRQFSYAVGTRYIWRIDERSGIPFRYLRDSVEKLTFVSGLTKGRSSVRGTG